MYFFLNASQLLAGARVNDTTPQKQTALHLAAEKDNSTIVSVLLENKANYDKLDDALNNGKQNKQEINLADIKWFKWNRLLKQFVLYSFHFQIYQRSLVQTYKYILL